MSSKRRFLEQRARLIREARTADQNAIPAVTAGNVTLESIDATLTAMQGAQASAPVVSADNSTTTPLSGAATFTGTWEDVSPYASISIIGTADVAGTLWADFSTDGSTQDRNLQLSAGDDGALGIHSLIPVAKYFRVRVVNGSGAQSSMRVQSILNAAARIAQPTSRLNQTVGNFSDVLTTRQANHPPLDISASRIGGRSAVHKFGHNPAVGTGFVPIAEGGVYNTPQVASATTLRVKAGNTNDTAAGTGAREITLQGLDETGAEITVVLATAGTSASSASSETFLRLYRVWVSASGTYASAVAGSHAADIVIENGAGGTDWATIDSGGFSHSQTEVGAYTVPLGKVGYLQSALIQVDSNKPADVLFFQRQNILETSAPYSAMRLVFQFNQILTSEKITPITPLGPFPALTDIGFMGKVTSGTGAVSVDFEIILEGA